MKPIDFLTRPFPLSSAYSGVARSAKAAFFAVMLALLTACASPIVAKVTSFNQWPGDVAGNTFSYVRPSDGINDLEQQAYEGYVQAELEKLGMKRAPMGQIGRMQVDIVTGTGTRVRQYHEPMYQDYYVFQPPYRNVAGQIFPGFWAPDRFGPRYIGDRKVSRILQVSNLRIKLLDSQNNAPGHSKAVFESRAVYEGDNEDLADLVPYLVRAIFDRFPGQNGQVHIVKFEPKPRPIDKR